jgi:sigma-E factor negative regulatory protein RseC
MEVANPAGASKGQRVVVAVEPDRLVKSSLLVYGIPIAALIAGAALGSQIARAAPGDEAADVGAIAGAAVFLGLALILMRALDRIVGRKVDSLPRIVEVVREDEVEIGGDGAY